MYRHSSNVNPFNKERRFSNNSNVEKKEQNENNNGRFPRPYRCQSNNKLGNYSRPQYNRNFYSSERKDVKKKPTFVLENNNFPTLSSETASRPVPAANTNKNNNTLNFSKMLQSTPISKEKAHPQPKKKFVSLVNLSKKKKNVEEEEIETDEEVEEMIEEQYNLMDEEMEEYYNEERAKEEYFDYEY